MLEAFYKDNYRIVYGFLLSLCGDPAHAEELTAETFCKAIEQIDRYDPQYRASTWLCTIGKNLFLNECRRRKRFVDLDEGAPLVSPSAETLCLQKEEVRRIMEIADTLSPASRQVFIMRLQGMGFRDIGAALGKSENWARVTFFRAKSRIRSEMEGDK